MTAQLRLRTVSVAAAVCAAVASAPLLTACGDTGGSRVAAAAPSPQGSRSGPASQRRHTEDQAERQALIQATKVPWDKAAATAVGGVEGGKLTEIELRWARAAVGSPSPGPRTPEWDTTVAAGDGTAHTVRVDAVTGKVTESRVDPGQDPEDKRELAARVGAAKVTPQQAAKTATDRTKGTITAVELDDTVWSVDVVTTNDWYKTTYDIDTRSGKVVREHVDRD
ncbi:PepSY domain-containing protein [Streptomyces sp. WAC05374]|uniref:PepSY domain-containing protein n=1 Tax=Streptomyces sp. WAC05374 TaxID=2487420 RepID=UPI001F270DD4|nr:PepSY domain-containing protein [Streptomyces sp. WAC05374]